MLAIPARMLASRCSIFSPLPADRARSSFRCVGAARSISSMTASSPEEDELVLKIGAGAGDRPVSLSEWQAWGTSSPFPSMVAEIVEDLRALEKEMGDHLSFGGLGGKLKGSSRIQEDKKSRALYETLTDSEQKLQYFSARQIACRLLGSRGYLCQKVCPLQCWLPEEDCMCSKLAPCSLWNKIRFWLYMHPKDFLRQNNTGKLLWQLFGVQSASLCLFGIQEQEEMMWDAFRHSGKSMVWFLYPNKSSTPKSVQEIICDGPLATSEDQMMVKTERKSLNFVLLDGTWSNSAAMYRRLKDHWASLWGKEEDLPCISFSTLGISSMHKLRPQPALDRTCTAAAAAGLLSELHHFYPELDKHGLDKQAEAVEDALDVLLDALTKRRLRMGRSITRKQRKMLLSK